MFDENQNLIANKFISTEYVTTDTAHHDYEENQMFVMFSEKEVERMIRALQWALSGLEDDFDIDEVLE